MRERLLNIHINGLSHQPLLIAVHGRDNLSYPYEFKLEVWSEFRLFQEADDLLMRPLYFTINQNGITQLYHGIIESLQEWDKNHDGYLTHLYMAPTFKALQVSHNYRCFIKQSVIDIVKFLFTEWRIDFDLSRLTKNYPILSCTILHNESHFNFISRLLESHGIYYYFVHDQTKHVMIFEDSGVFTHRLFHLALSYCNGTSIKHHLYDWQRTVSLSDLAQTKIITKSNYLGIQAGYQFALNPELSSENDSYYIYSLTIAAQDHSKYLNGEQTQSYQNTLWAYPITNPFTPKIRFHDEGQIQIYKPIAPLTSAIITGPKQKELYSDYSGRVKLQFHWDRFQHKNENSSHWINAGHLWAGNGYGTLFIPRIGDEVLVDFENGDPDKPFVIGALTNANNRSLFKTSSQSGWKSHTIRSNKSLDGNILRFDDSKNSEEIYLKAQKDLNVSALGNSTKSIGGNAITEIKKGNFTQQVNGVLKIIATKEIQITCGKSLIIITANGITFSSHCISLQSVVSLEEGKM